MYSHFMVENSKVEETSGRKSSSNKLLPSQKTALDYILRALYFLRICLKRKTIKGDLMSEEKF